MIEPYFNRQLQCCLWGYFVDIKKRRVTLSVAPGNCTDMQGAIKFAKRRLPSVEEIEVLSDGANKDRFYVFEANVWRSLRRCGERRWR